MIETCPILQHLNDDIAYKEVRKALRKMINHKAAGPNDLPMSALKVMALYANDYNLWYNNPNAETITFIFELLSLIWQGAPILEDGPKVT